MVFIDRDRGARVNTRVVLGKGGADVVVIHPDGRNGKVSTSETPEEAARHAVGIAFRWSGDNTVNVQISEPPESDRNREFALVNLHRLNYKR